MKTAKGTGIKVTINMQQKPAMPAQNTAWRKFWQKLIAEVSTKESFSFQNNHREEPRR